MDQSLAIPLCRPGDLATAKKNVMVTRVGSRTTSYMSTQETFLVIGIHRRHGVSSGAQNDFALILRSGTNEGLWYVPRDQLYRLF